MRVIIVAKRTLYCDIRMYSRLPSATNVLYFKYFTPGVTGVCKRTCDFDSSGLFIWNKKGQITPGLTHVSTVVGGCNVAGIIVSVHVVICMFQLMVCE